MLLLSTGLQIDQSGLVLVSSCGSLKMHIQEPSHTLNNWYYFVIRITTLLLGLDSMELRNGFWIVILQNNETNRLFYLATST